MKVYDVFVKKVLMTVSVRLRVYLERKVIKYFSSPFFFLLIAQLK